MNTTFKATGFIASEHLQSLAKEKVAKLYHQNDSIIRIDIALHQGDSGEIDNQYCEITVSIPGENLFVKKNSERYEKSIDDAVQALRKIMRREKEKQVSIRKNKNEVI